VTARDIVRRLMAAVLACGMPAWSQQVSIAPVRPQGPVYLRPYREATVGPVRLDDSPRLHELMRAGSLYLTVQDAIALALENNIDLEISRYNPVLGEWRVLRAEAGGALPGVPSASAQAGTVAAGQGVTGSQQAAGVSIPGGRGGQGGSNAQVSQIGPVTQNLDPVFQQSTTFSHVTTPQSNTVQSLTTALISDTRNYSGSMQIGTLSGGLARLSYSNTYLNENSVSNLLNPTVAPSLSLAVQHNLLRGFGRAMNARQITISKMNLDLSDLSFRTQVIGLVSQVLNAYYGLSAAAEDLKAKRNALQVAGEFLKNVRERIELGNIAPPEEINAQRQLVNSRQAVQDAEASLAQQEIRLKDLISRQGLADPLLTAARIVLVDKLAMPAKDDLPPVDEMVKQALATRADLESAKLREKTSEVSSLGTRNGLLPTLQVFGATSHAGLAGTPRTLISGPNTRGPDPYFAGGIGTALGQVFRRNFPTERIGAVIATTIGNNQAQADYAIDLLQQRQTQLQTQRDRNQVRVDVLNNVVAMEQARARYQAAVKDRELRQELYRGEQTRYSLGASTPYNMILQQRDLVTAEAAVTTALVAYSNARVALDRVVGRTLEVNQIRIEEARTGVVSKR
jgi:outer membrane protein TolC